MDRPIHRRTFLYEQCCDHRGFGLVFLADQRMSDPSRKSFGYWKAAETLATPLYFAELDDDLYIFWISLKGPGKILRVLTPRHEMGKP
jgi:hypothetical protein